MNISKINRAINNSLIIIARRLGAGRFFNKPKKMGTLAKGSIIKNSRKIAEAIVIKSLQNT
jgi:hypothetical protein